MVSIAVDADVCVKLSAYALLECLPSVLTVAIADVGFLGATPFVVHKIRITAEPARVAVARAQLNRFFESATRLEPGLDELELAIELETIAAERGLQLDVGESQLAAIASLRSFGAICSGDKRAIAALEVLVCERPVLLNLKSSLICFEVLIGAFCEMKDCHAIRDAVCGAPATDKALTICFACHRSAVAEADVRSGIQSYVDDVVRKAPTLARSAIA